MLPIDLFLSFSLASAILSLAPGPDNIFVLTQSALNGRVAGVVITLGLCTGLLFHTALVAFGVAIIFQTSAIAFNLLKIAGAMYLLYLAWMAFGSGSAEIGGEGGSSVSLKKLYRRGIIMNITNPKVSIFFLAFLPQFANIKHGPLMPQIFLLGFTFIVIALLIFCLVAVAASYLREKLANSPRSQSVLNKIAGTVFIALAVKLAFSER